MGNEIIIRERKSSKHGKTYEYRFETASVGGKRQWRSKSGFLTAKDAKLAGTAALAEYNSCGKVIEPTEMSFSDFLDYWMEHDCRVSLKDVTITNYSKKIKNHIKPALGEYRLKTIEKDRLQDFLQEMYNNGYAHNTLAVIKGILTKCFSYAADRKYILSSPADGLKLPKGEVTKVPTRSAPHSYIEPAQMIQIFERFPENSPAYIPLMIGYHCGLRIGEVFGLTWDDVDLKNKTLTVNRQIQWRQYDRSNEEKHQTNGKTVSEAGCWYFSKPKYNSMRKIEMDDSISALLIREKERQEAARAYYKDRYIRYYEDEHHEIKPSEGKEVHFVSIRENGTYINSRTMQHTSAIIHSQLGLTDFDFHSLRHTHATMLLEQGAPLKYVQQRLGHKRIDVTINIYQHMTEELRQNGVDTINRMFCEL